MHKIETAALMVLRNDYNFIPRVFARYIDDLIIGPMDKTSTLPSQILDVFNSINEDISFTLDGPNEHNILNFLDRSIKTNVGKIEYSWYSKPCHPENSLRRDCFVPHHVKRNFVDSYMKNVTTKCSNSELREIAQKSLRKD